MVHKLAQWNRLKYKKKKQTRKSKNTCGNLVYDKDSISSHWRKKITFLIKLDLSYHTQEWTEDETMWVLEENMNEV